PKPVLRDRAASRGGLRLGNALRAFAKIHGLEVTLSGIRRAVHALAFGTGRRKEVSRQIAEVFSTKRQRTNCRLVYVLPQPKRHQPGFATRGYERLPAPRSEERRVGKESTLP